MREEKAIVEFGTTAAKDRASIIVSPIQVGSKARISTPMGSGHRTGIDIVSMPTVRSGTNIVSTVDGEVLRTGTYSLNSSDQWIKQGKACQGSASECYGNFIDIRDKNGYIHRYAHPQTKFVNATNTDGTPTQVRAGQKIATIGDTGNAWGPHLHYQVWHESEGYDFSKANMVDIEKAYKENTGKDLDKSLREGKP